MPEKTQVSSVGSLLLLFNAHIQTLAFDGTLSALLWRVCRKWMLDESEMYFHLVGSTEPLPPTMTCKELGANEIVLSKKKNRMLPYPYGPFLIVIWVASGN